MKKKLLISFLTLFVTLNISTAANANTNNKEKYSKLTTKTSESISEIYISDEDKLNAINNPISTYSLSEDSFYEKYPDIYEAKTSASNEPEKVSISTLSTSGFKQLKYSFKFFPSSTIYNYGGNQMRHGTYMQNTGCGAVAAGNMLAYDAKYYGRTKLYNKAWTSSGYYDYEQAIFDNYFKGPTLISKMKTNLPLYAKNNGNYSYNYKLIENIYDPHGAFFIALKNSIKNAIDNEYPVALMFGPNWSNSYSDSLARPDLANHWVVVTGYNPNDTEQITISTWGEEEVVDLWYLIRSKSFIDQIYFTWPAS